MNQDPWYDRAACASTDPAIFLDERQVHQKYRWKEARKICATCPVIESCLEEAMGHASLPHWQNRQMFSMFQAGLTPHELNALYLSKESEQAA